jgi:hypothetical protein
MKLINATLLAVSLSLFAAPVAGFAQADMMKDDMKMSMKMGMTTSAFKGVEVNGGTASISKVNGKQVLSVSSDFKIPTSPAPHFQVVDTKGNVYLLQRLTIVGDKTHRSVTLPSYIKDVAKVQIWCSFAEVLLGEAKFEKAVTLR